MVILIGLAAALAVEHGSDGALSQPLPEPATPVVQAHPAMTAMATPAPVPADEQTKLKLSDDSKHSSVAVDSHQGDLAGFPTLPGAANVIFQDGYLFQFETTENVSDILRWYLSTLRSSGYAVMTPKLPDSVPVRGVSFTTPTGPSGALVVIPAEQTNAKTVVRAVIQ